MTITNAGPVFAAAVLSDHLRELFIVTAADWGLSIVTSLQALDDVARRPADKFFTAFAGEFGEEYAAISWNAAALDPVLDGLIGDAHLPRHVGNGLEFRDGSLECWVLLHGSCQRLLNLKTILAQAPLVAQETFQLPQGLPVEILPL